ncbi:MAG: hypothetical protein M3Y51_05995 [Actinomycetota bacterium]|nr:hypothetical protein [Actinomycetota bacterium]
MNEFETTAAVLRNAEWSTVADAAAPILRRATLGAVLQERRIELSYDWERGEYELGPTVVSTNEF